MVFDLLSFTARSLAVPVLRRIRPRPGAVEPGGGRAHRLGARSIPPGRGGVGRGGRAGEGRNEEQALSGVRPTALLHPGGALWTPALRAPVSGTQAGQDGRRGEGQDGGAGRQVPAHLQGQERHRARRYAGDHFVLLFTMWPDMFFLLQLSSPSRASACAADAASHAAWTSTCTWQWSTTLTPSPRPGASGCSATMKKEARQRRPAGTGARSKGALQGS